MKVENPDKRRIYHIWHYCRVCGKTWTHSQADWDDLIKHVKDVHIGNWSVIASASTETECVEVEDGGA